MPTDFTDFQAMVENVPETRPGPMFRGVDRYFDEPEQTDGRLTGLLGWAAKANEAQRGALFRFTAWCFKARDFERRVIFVLMDRYQGRLPCGAVNDIADLAGVSREAVRIAIKNFSSAFPGCVSESRRKVDRGS